jgi:hypothetical protein
MYCYILEQSREVNSVLRYEGSTPGVDIVDNFEIIIWSY